MGADADLTADSRSGVARWHLAVVVLLSAAIWTVYAPVRFHDYVNFDDNVYILENPHVRSGLSWENVRWAFTTAHEAYWLPLTWISFMLDCQLWGVTAGPALLVNVALHNVNALLLYVLLYKLTGRPGRSAFVAALFALHPLRVESVAWVSQRKDVLSTAFWLLTTLGYVSYVRRPGIVRYVGMCAAFACGLLVKPMLVTLPATLLLLDLWPLRRWQLEIGDAAESIVALSRRLLLEKIPLFALAAVAAWIVVRTQSSVGAVPGFDAVSAGIRIPNALTAYLRYVGMLAWPADLAVFYPLRPIAWWWGAVSAVTLAVVSVAALIGWRRLPYVTFGWLWYVITLLPVIGFVQVGGQALADRYTYVPSIGLFVAATWLVAEFSARRQVERAGLAVTAALVLALCALATSRQIPHWRNSVTLFERALRVTSDNFIAHTNLGVSLERAGQLDEAGEHYAKAVRIHPGYPEARNNLGQYLGIKGRNAEAEEHFRAALQIRPGMAVAESNLGTALARQGRHAEAIDHYRRALALQPANTGAHLGLADTLALTGRRDEAVQHYHAVIRLDPGRADAHSRLGALLAERGNLDAARLVLSRAVDLGVRDPATFDRLGNVLVRLGDTAAATTAYRAAVEGAPQWAQARQHLASVLAAQGQYAQAIAEYREARRLQPGLPGLSYNLGLALLEVGEHREAAAHLREARSDPAVAVDATLQLAWVLATSPDDEVRDGGEALGLVEPLVARIGPEGVAAVDELDTLAAAYAATGQFARAVDASRRALRTVASSGDEGRAAAIRARISLYEQGQPFRGEVRKPSS